jgi:hypothetical protein
LGAALGLLTVRGLLPPEKRNALNYAIGAGTGAAVGGIGGSYLDAYGPELGGTPSAGAKGALKRLSQSFKANPGGTLTNEEAKDLFSLVGQKEYDAGIGSPVELGPAVPREAPGRSSDAMQRTYEARMDELRSLMSGRSAKLRGDEEGARSAEQTGEIARQRAVNPHGGPDAGLLKGTLKNLLTWGIRRPIEQGKDIIGGSLGFVGGTAAEMAD